MDAVRPAPPPPTIRTGTSSSIPVACSIAAPPVVCSIAVPPVCRIGVHITIEELKCQLQNLRYAGHMSAPAEVRPNRRGVKSRERVLDAAERIMAEHGFEAATLARVVEESGIPMSSVYHYFGSKDRILLAVMERGAAPGQGRVGRCWHARAPPGLPPHADRLRRAASGRRRRGNTGRRPPGT